MPTTPNYSFPYPLATDPADIPTDMRELAEAVDTSLDTVDDRVDALEPRVTSLESADAALDSRLDTLEPTIPVNRIAPGTVTGQVLTNGAGNVPTWAAAGGGGAMALIEAKVLGAAGPLDFTAIPATFRHLRLVGHVRCTESGDFAALGFNLNGDANGADYLSQQVQAFNNAFGNTADPTRIAFMASATSTANYFTSFELLIPDYTSTAFWRSCIGRGGAYRPSQSRYETVFHAQVTWQSLAVVNRVQLLNGPWNAQPTTANFVAGSRATLYGIG